MLKRETQNTIFLPCQFIFCLLTCSLCPQFSQSQETEDKTANVVEVVVPGIGLSKEEAQKDAYRNAVRQVVGLYVDSKTLVENDQLIEDKVLSASNGVVRTAHTISDSVTENNGLWRLRARVTVEVTRVKSVLAEANVTMRKIDGESLFAKALSKMEKKQNSTDLLKELLSELPQMLKLSLQGEPDYDTETGELLYTVELQPDIEAYREFLPRITKALEAVAVKRLPDTVVKPVPSGSLRSDFFDDVEGVFGIDLGFGGIKNPRTDSSQAIISLLASWNKKHQSHKWIHFIVDVGDFSEKNQHWMDEFRWIEPTGKWFRGRGQALNVEVEFLDQAGKSIDVDMWPLVFDEYSNYELDDRDDDDDRDWGRLTSGALNTFAQRIEDNGRYLQPMSNSETLLESKSHNYWIRMAPLCMAWSHQNHILFRERSIASRRIKIDADQLSKFDKVEIRFNTSVKE